MKYSKNKSGSGFTLIELLVVVAIIGIVASIVIQNLSSARERAQNATRLSNIDQINKSLELYLTKSAGASFPTTASSWECIGLVSGICWSAPTYPPATTVNTALTGNISAIPRDPSIPSGSKGDYYIYNSQYVGTSGIGAYLSWVTTSAGSCGRGYQVSLAIPFQTCALFLGK